MTCDITTLHLGDIKPHSVIVIKTTPKNAQRVARIAEGLWQGADPTVRVLITDLNTDISVVSEEMMGRAGWYRKEVARAE